MYGIFSLDGGQTSNYPKYQSYRYGIIEPDNYLSGKVIRRSFGQDFWAQISQPKVPGINSRDNFLTRASKRKRVVSVSKHASTLARTTSIVFLIFAQFQLTTRHYFDPHLIV